MHGGQAAPMTRAVRAMPEAAPAFSGGTAASAPWLTRA